MKKSRKFIDIDGIQMGTWDRTLKYTCTRRERSGDIVLQQDRHRDIIKMISKQRDQTERS